MPPRGALRGGNRRISEDCLEKASAFDFGGRSSQLGVWGHQPPSIFQRIQQGRNFLKIFPVKIFKIFSFNVFKRKLKLNRKSLFTAYP
jgi:hypothetical protein